MNRQLVNRANALVNAAGAAGLVVGLGEAVRALRRYGGQYDRAYQFIARNARRDRAGNIQSRVNQRLGLNMDRMVNYGGPPKRRRFVGPAAPVQRAVGNNAPAGYQAMTYHKRSYGNKRKRNIIADMKRQFINGQTDMILRYQSLVSPQPTTATLLSKSLINLKTASDLYTSCFAFNLSSLGYQPWSDIKVVPFYRLTKRLNNAGNLANWYWHKQSGALNDALGTSASDIWQKEHLEGYYSNANEYRHDWSDIRLLFQGSVKYPTRVHVYRVKFAHEGLGPDRQYYTRTNVLTTYDVMCADPKEFNEADYFWERFMLPKIVHPFANTKKTGLTDRKHLVVLSHEVMSIGSEVTISADVQPLQHMHRMFVRNGKTYGLNDAQNCEASLMPDAAVPPKCGIKGDGAPGFSNVTDINNVAPMGVDRTQDEWLLIVAENYQETGSGYDPEKEVSIDNSPSFDICVRNKYTLYNKA